MDGEKNEPGGGNPELELIMELAQVNFELRVQNVLATNFLFRARSRYWVLILSTRMNPQLMGPLWMKKAKP